MMEATKTVNKTAEVMAQTEGKYLTFSLVTRSMASVY